MLMYVKAHVSQHACLLLKVVTLPIITLMVIKGRIQMSYPAWLLKAAMMLSSGLAI